MSYQEQARNREAIAAARTRLALLEKGARTITSKLAELPITEREAVAAALQELQAGANGVRQAHASAPNSRGRARYGYYGNGGSANENDPNQPACAVYLLFGGVEQYYLALLEAFYDDHAPTKAGRAAGEAAACARLDGPGRAELLFKIATEHGCARWRQPGLPDAAEDSHSTDVVLSHSRRDGDIGTGFVALHRRAPEEDDAAPADAAAESSGVSRASSQMSGYAAPGEPPLYLSDRSCDLDEALTGNLGISRMTTGYVSSLCCRMVPVRHSSR